MLYIQEKWLIYTREKPYVVDTFRRNCSCILEKHLMLCIQRKMAQAYSGNEMHYNVHTMVRLLHILETPHTLYVREGLMCMLCIQGEKPHIHHGNA